MEKITDAKQGDGAAVTLQSQDGTREADRKVLLYPNLPVIRKSLSDQKSGQRAGSAGIGRRGEIYRRPLTTPLRLAGFVTITAAAVRLVPTMVTCRMHC